MDATEQLKLRSEKVPQEMDVAMKAGQMNGVINFVHTIKEADEALRGISSAVERMSAQLESGHEGFDLTEVRRPERSRETSNSPSRKARGKACRDSDHLNPLLSVVTLVAFFGLAGFAKASVVSHK